MCPNILRTIHSSASYGKIIITRDSNCYISKNAKGYHLAMADRSRQTRKRRTTTRTIQDAALDLFAEQGYENTTLKEIAERADVAPRTLTHHFPAKHDLLFAMDHWPLEPLKTELDKNVGKQSVFDTVRAWHTKHMNQATDGEDETHFWRRRRLRVEIIHDNPVLQGHAAASFTDTEKVISDALTIQYALRKNALAPKLAAVALMGGLREIHYYSAEITATGAPLGPMIDEVFLFAQCGLDALLS